MIKYSRVKSSWARLLILGVIGVAAVGGSIILQARWSEITTTSEGPQAPLASRYIDPEEKPGLPARLIIPKIGVDTKVQHVGLTADGDMGIPTNYTDVAWYKEGPRPGEQGSAVLAGHLDGRNTPRAVFYDLEKLVEGDIVKIVDEDGTVFQFKVTKKKSYDYEDAPAEVFSSDGTHLNLITCTGDWMPAQRMYDERIVVFTEFVGVDEEV